MRRRAVDPASTTSSKRGPDEPRDTEREYSERLDAGLLRIGGVCLLISVMTGLSGSIVTVAQRTFVGAFHSTPAVVAWTIVGYVLGVAAVIPMTGWAVNRFGTKRLFMGAVLAFTLGSLLCALAPNIELLILFRTLQGLGGGMLTPLTLTILTREAGPKRLGRLIALGAIPLLLAPICGPILGGWLIRAHGWEWMFLINLPVGLAAFGLGAILFPRDQPTPSESFDWIGVLLLLPGAATLLYGVSSIPGRGMVADRHVWIATVTGLALLTAFVLHAWYRADHPLIDLRLLTNRVVGTASLAMFVLAAGASGAGLLFPSYFQQLMHQTPMQSAMHLIPLGLGAMLTVPLAGAFTDKVVPGRIALVGIALFATGLGIFAYGVAKQADYLPTLLFGLAIAGVGSGCTIIPLAGAAVQTFAQDQIARGWVLITVNQLIAGAAGTALASVILTSQFNRSENISAANQMVILQRNAAESRMPVDPSAVPRQSLAPDFMSNVQHDLSSAYAVVFVVAAVLVAMTLIPAAFLLKKPAAVPPCKAAARVSS